MVLEPKEELSTDGIKNNIGIKGISYICDENHSKEYVSIETDMPPANGHLVSYYYFYLVFVVFNLLKKNS